MGHKWLRVSKVLGADELRKLARREKDGRVSSRIFALANVLDGMSRDAAARQAGMTKDQKYKCATIFGAVCPAHDKGAAIVMPKADTHAMNEHLKEISLHVSAGAHAVVVIDGAGWHRPGERLAVPENISLLHLPPYSPELNAQENIWQYLRQNYLAGRIFETFDEIIEACCTAWNKLIIETGRITSIASRDWFKCKTS